MGTHISYFFSVLSQNWHESWKGTGGNDLAFVNVIGSWDSFCCTFMLFYIIIGEHTCPRDLIGPTSYLVSRIKRPWVS